MAAKITSAADTNGDGSLSLSKVEKALGADTTTGAEAASSANALSQAFASIDTNGDDQISASELTNALDAQNGTQGAQGAHHHHHHAHKAEASAPPSSSDLAAKILGAADTNGDG